MPQETADSDGKRPESPEAGLCSECEEPKRPVHARGLCAMHYKRLNRRERRERKGLPPSKQIRNFKKKAEEVLGEKKDGDLTEDDLDEFFLMRFGDLVRIQDIPPNVLGIIVKHRLDRESELGKKDLEQTELHKQLEVIQDFIRSEGLEPKLFVWLEGTLPAPVSEPPAEGLSIPVRADSRVEGEDPRG
jgi:hypothetical protein